MTLNDAYLVSQTAAAVLVAPTLLYLALQVRQNTVQSRAVARYQFVDAIASSTSSRRETGKPPRSSAGASRTSTASTPTNGRNLSC